MSTGNELVTLKQVDNCYKDLRKRSAPVIFNTATGNPAVFSDGADGLPIQSLKVHLLPRQEGTGDPSPENIRDFIPLEGIGLFQTHKNLFDISTLENKQGITVEGSMFYGTAEAFNNGTRNNKAIPFFLPKGTTFTVTAVAHRSSANSGSGWALYFNYADGTNVRPFYTANSVVTPTKYSGTITADKDIVSLTFGYFNNWLSGIWYVNQMQVEVGTKSTEYEPFVPIIETGIEFPSNFYAGILELETGKLWGTHKRELLNDANAWIQGTEYISYSNHVFDDRKKGNSWIGQCSAFVIQQGVASGTPFARWGGADAGNFIISANGSGLTVSDVQTLAQNDQLELVYELAEPVLIATLTPIQLQSLYGSNTIWSDANGDIEVEYRANTGLFLKQNTVKDVQINGSSILDDGIANIPPISSGGLGLARSSNNGIQCNSEGQIFTKRASSAEIKEGTHNFNVIVPSNQHESAFYALAKLAGADMAQSSNPVGQFTDEAKVAIKEMLGIYDASFRFINEITVQEDCSYAEIDHDSYGLPFSLHEIVVKIISKQTNGTGNGAIVPNAIATNSDSPYVTIYNIFRDSGDFTAYVHAWIAGKRFFGEAPQSSMTQAYTPAIITRNPNASGISELDSITSITYKSLNAYTVKAGTVITLYGR